MKINSRVQEIVNSISQEFHQSFANEAVYQKINDYLALFESLLEKMTMQQP